MTTVPPLTLSAINALDRDAFIAALGGLFEGPPWIVAAAWAERPFRSLADLHRALCHIMETAHPDHQVALLQAHPDLVGRAALAGTLSPASTGEQAAAGLDRLTPDDIATFTRLNQAYRLRFGFPFVICARENKKDSITASFVARLHNTRDQEIATALGEVTKICALRLADLIHDDRASA
jgi:OHCU decarboxylase